MQRLSFSILAGARGFLLKNGGPDELLLAVRAAARGETLLDPALAGRVVDSLTALAADGQSPQEADAAPLGDEESPPELPLSNREREVLALLVDTLTNKQIAEILYISESTVKNHVSNILRKLGLDNRHQAAAFAARQRGTAG